MVEVNIQDTFGAGFIGGMIAAIMYGITTLQTYLYYVYFPTDSHSLKFLVALIWVLDTLHVSFMCHALYHYLVSSFGDADALTTAIWSLVGSLGLNLCMAVIVQTYFTFRISHLTRSSIRWWLTCGIMVVVFAHFGFGLETVVLMFEKKEFSALQQITLYAATPFAIAAVLSDVCITIALCVLLHGNRSPIIETNALVNTLIVYAINRCLLTSVVAVAEVIAFAISPASLWFIAIDFVIGKLYANSFLASLNSRSALRGRSHTHSEGTSFRVNTINLSGLGSGTGTSSEGDSHAGAQNKPPNVLRGAHVKTNSVGDRSLHEMGNLDKGEV
ncbi:hypothetical protein K503DRAFT_771470 [Rhizopogon vinicolor AM-OR11-026]|uniref:DUF6534 domain-containing protein n=1 Tax=Rhizopogon vinicolor AM-OR11-026 TaxID=1314800 RepID=A0A1B7MY43_9AGAM|nr:hypothetical protein K503DRAFT_771470 [Rhizopogon vinicolor AM-OR11-026]